MGNQCIQLISPNGSILKTIGKGGLRKPVGCLCYEDKVFVSDYDAHLIKVYNFSDGRFLYEFGRHDTVDVELNEPIGLAVDKERHLLVCSGYSFDNPHRILVYTLDGKLYIYHNVWRIGWFQKISIPIPRAASRNSEGEGGLRRLEFRGHGGVTSTGIPRTWGGFIGLEFRRHTGVFLRVTSSLV